MNMNIEGRRFGRLAVISRLDAPDAQGEMPRPSYYSAYLCKCDCGAEVKTTYYALFQGKTSCGCDRVPRQRDLTGKRFGALTAIKPLLREADGTLVRGDDAFLRWECRCDCGNVVAVHGLRLTAGVTASCGCIAAMPRRDGDSHRVKSLCGGETMRNNTTGVNGVTYADRAHTRYRVSIGFRGADLDLGCYPSLETAGAVRKRAEKLLFDPAADRVEIVEPSAPLSAKARDALSRRMSARSAKRAAERDYPLNAEMIRFLNESLDARRLVWQMMDPDSMEPDDSAVIGARVREFREKAGLSIRGLAEAAGLGRSYLARVEKGLSCLTEEAADRIAQRFEGKCTAEWLLYGIVSNNDCPYSPEMNDWLKHSCELRKLVRLAHELNDAPRRTAKPQRRKASRGEGEPYINEDAGELSVIGQPSWSARQYARADEWSDGYSDDVYMN